MTGASSCVCLCLQRLSDDQTLHPLRKQLIGTNPVTMEQFNPGLLLLLSINYAVSDKSPKNASNEKFYTVLEGAQFTYILRAHPV